MARHRAAVPDAQAQLVLTLCEELGEPLHLVGHSFGASVALKAAALLGPRVGSLILLEPNPFYLLKQNGRLEAFLESRSLRDHVKCYGALGDWAKVAERFADYWSGDGSWSTIPEGGHMAPLTRPELVNPVIRQFLDAA